MAKSRGYDGGRGGRLKSLLTAWTLGSAVAIMTPVIVLVVGAIAHRIDCRNGGGGQWCHQNDRGGDDYWYGGRAAVVFAFVWSYLLFVWLAGYGHAALSAASESGLDGSSRWKRYMCSKRAANSGMYNVGMLTGGTIFFGNLSFLLGMVLASTLGSGREQLLRRSSIIPLAFLLWALFCLVFSCWLLQFQPASRADGRDADDVAAASSDYRRVTDGRSDARRGAGSSASSSSPPSEPSSSRGRSRERTNGQSTSSGPEDGSKKKGFFSRLTGSTKSKERNNKSNGAKGSDDSALLV